MGYLVRAILLLVVLPMLGAGCAASGPSARIERVSYGPWDGAYRLSNGIVDVVVVPQIGRIVRYGYVGGPNVLWESVDEPKTIGGWLNHGGDKQWPWPQANWKWPPPVPTDAGPYSATVRRNGTLLLRGPVDPAVGIRAEREIQLAATGTELTQTYRLIGSDAPANTGRRWGAWSITQVAAPSRVLAHQIPTPTATPAATRPADKHPWPPPHPLANDWLAYTPVYNHAKSFLSADALGAVVGETFFLQRRRPHPRDEEIATEIAQIYAVGQDADFGEVPYVELEFISPPQALGPREASELTVAWTLQPASAISAVNK